MLELGFAQADQTDLGKGADGSGETAVEDVPPTESTDDTTQVIICLRISCNDNSVLMSDGHYKLAAQDSLNQRTSGALEEICAEQFG